MNSTFFKVTFMLMYFMTRTYKALNLEIEDFPEGQWYLFFPITNVHIITAKSKELPMEYLVFIYDLYLVHLIRRTAVIE